jgi:hypothetical protein
MKRRTGSFIRKRKLWNRTEMKALLLKKKKKRRKNNVILIRRLANWLKLIGLSRINSN